MPRLGNFPCLLLPLLQHIISLAVDWSQIRPYAASAVHTRIGPHMAELSQTEKSNVTASFALGCLVLPCTAECGQTLNEM